MPNTISAEPLAQIVRSISLQKRTGLLRVEQLGERGIEPGEVYFEAGRPVRAYVGQETGKMALKRISGWKHITCSFTGMSRPYPLETPVQSLPEEQKTEEAGRSRLPSNSRQTGNLAYVPLSLQRAPWQGESGQPVLPVAARTVSPSPGTQSTGPIVSTNPGAAISSRPPVQPLVMRGNTLEEYTPTPQPAVSRSVQRWTTHRILSEQSGTLARRLPATPRLEPFQTEGSLPGRMAVFKAREMVTTTRPLHLMERRERIIFILLDGTRTIQDIARLTHYTESEVEQVLLDLTQNGYTEQLAEPSASSSIHEKMVNLFAARPEHERTFS